MITKLSLTFRIIFLYSMVYIVSMALMIYKSFTAGYRKAKGELKIVWAIKPVE